MNKTFAGGTFFDVNETNKPFSLISNANNLPLISLNQIESEINVNKKKKGLNSSQYHLQGFNNKQFNVCSPFYDRMKTHKQNCKCPYHRKRRLQVLPARHSDKLGTNEYDSLGKQLNKDNSKLFRFSNKQNSQNKLSSLLNNSFDQGRNQNYQNLFQNLKPKIDSYNVRYQKFLKECEYFMLKRNGFQINKSSHVVRKGVREIFQFINGHMDYTVEKMMNWVKTFQKDKDYGEFYIDRFKEMKLNYQRNLNRSRNKDQNIYNKTSYPFRTKKVTTQKLKKSSQGNLLKQKNNELNEKTLRNKQKNIDFNKNEKTMNDQNSQNKQDQSDSDAQGSQVTLERIMNQLKKNGKISNRLLQDIVQMDIQQFKKIFTDLQNNVKHSKYQLELLKQFQLGVLGQLTRKLSTQSNKVSDQKDKLAIVSQAHQFIRKYRQRKLSHLSDRNSMKSTSSKPFFGSKRNTQNGDSSKAASIMNSKKSSTQELPLDENQGTLNQPKYDEHLMTQNLFEAIEQENENDEDNSTNKQKAATNLLSHGPNVRRSKLLRSEQMFKFTDESKDRCNSSLDEFEDHEHQLQKSVVQPHKGFFRKAQKYLFDVNLGKAIVKNDDSIFTAKRKVRVIKMLLLQNPTTPEADQLRDYIKTVEQRCYEKTQKDKRLNMAKKNSQTENIDDQQIWKYVSLQNMGFNLIFYNLTSKIKLQDNQDLCILLHEMKSSDAKRLDNQISYKQHLFLQEDQLKKKKKSHKLNDELAQQEMRNMEFQPEIQSEDQMKITDMTKRSTRTNQKQLKKTINQINRLSKQSKVKAFIHSHFNQQKYAFIEEQIDDLNEFQLEEYKRHIKKILKYAKINLPQTFSTYVKNVSICGKIFQQSVNISRMNFDVDLNTTKIESLSYI